MRFTRLISRSLVPVLTLSVVAALDAQAQKTSEANLNRRRQNLSAGKTRLIFLSALSSPGMVAPTTGSDSRHYDLGLQYKQKGDLNHALIEFLQAIKENPRCTKAFYEQALIFRVKNYPKLAESSLTQALAVDPTFREARILLAAVRLELGNAGGAAAELSRSLGLSEVKPARVAPPVKHQPQTTPPSASASAPASGWTETSGQTSALTSASTSGQTSALTAAPAVGQVPPKNGLVFTPEGSESKRNSSAGLTSAAKERTPVSTAQSPSEVPKLDSDTWALRLKYLNEHGTGSLNSGEAFMFAEDTGEAVLLLSDGKKIVRRIAQPLNHNELVKNRRPDMLLPSDLMYKLSTLGKLVTDPSAIVDLATSAGNKESTRESARESSKDSTKNQNTESNKDTGRHSNLGELMDASEEKASNFLSKPYLEDAASSATAPSAAFPAGMSTSFKETAGKDGTAGKAENNAELYEGLSSEESTASSKAGEPHSNADSKSSDDTRTNAALKNADNNPNQQPVAALGEAIVERTQKFVGWLKKTLRIQ